MSNYFKQITVFLQVAESGSFTQAAELLNLSRAMVSISIKQLEENLGVSLFNRSTRQVSLSDAGQFFYQDCKNIKQDLQKAIERIQNNDILLSGTLRIGSTHEFGERFIAPILADFCQQYPSLGLHYYLDSSINDLITDKLDIAIRLGNLPDSTLKSRHLGQYEIVLVATPTLLQNHPITQASDILSMPWVVQNQWQYNQFVLTHTQQPHSNFHFSAPMGLHQSNSASLIHSMVKAGLGISICPLWMVKEDLDKQVLQRVLPDYTLPQQNIQAVYLNQRHTAQRIRLFIDFLKARLLV